MRPQTSNAAESRERKTLRIQKFLSQAGVASRRAAEDLVRAGRVRLNGQVVTELGARVDPERDRIEVDGRPVSAARTRWILLHKPPGYVTTAHDPQGRPTVFDLLPADAHGLRHVGRLDLDSEGLLLFSNEGDLVQGLLHPRFQIEREYEAWTRGVPDRATLTRLERGVVLEDGPARARSVRLLASERGRGHVRLVLTEGRKREVRRMLAAVGHPVERLRRVRFGPVQLGRLEAGAHRDLTPDERAGLAALLDGA